MTRTVFYKAVRPDGGSFHDPSFKWATEPGGITTHPNFRKGDDPAGYLSVATVPTDCTGMRWPARLLVVEAIPGHPVLTPDPLTLPNKRAAGAFRTVEERPAHELLGPQAEALVFLLSRAGGLTAQEAGDLLAARKAVGAAARSAARDTAWLAARVAARDTAWAAAWAAARLAAGDTARRAAGDAVRLAAWDAADVAARFAAGLAAGDAAEALCVRDLVGTGDWTREAYETLVGPWTSVVGKVHPDD